MERKEQNKKLDKKQIEKLKQKKQKYVNDKKLIKK